MGHTELIGYRMRYFKRCMKRLVDQKNREREETYGMSMTDGWILRYLNEHEGQEVFQKNIETDLHIKKSALTQQLNEMEAHGLIRRNISEHDSRYKCISRTEKAIEIHQQIMDEIEEHERLMMHWKSGTRCRGPGMTGQITGRHGVTGSFAIANGTAAF